MECSREKVMPAWWFQYFESVWTPFVQRLCRQKKITLLEFERAASQVPGLTHIEKTIAVSAYRLQQDDESLPSPHREYNRSVV